jgi:hypothetical protein
MASTYVNDLRLNEMATGDASGSWGTVTNTNLELIGEAFSYGTETIGDADSTLTIADGAADAARSFYLKITSSVDLTTTRIVTLAPNTVSKVWMIENATTGSQVITIKQGSGATINVPNGQVKMISTDGAGSGGAVLDLLVDVDLTGTTTLVNLDVSGAVDIAGDLTLSAGGDGALRFTAASSVKVLDNNAAALVFEEADNAYMTFVTTDGSEAVKFDKALDINAATQIDATVTVGVDDTGYDVKFFGATAGAYMLWDESADDLILGGAAGLSVNSAALVTGVLTTTAATVSNGGGQFNGAINVGVDDTGYDVKFFGATAGKYMLWDESADTLEVSGTVVAGAGTALLPSITTTGDLNTGIFFPAADTIAFAEGGAEAARFDSSGRLLIGSTASQENNHRLQITGGDQATSSISVSRLSADQYGAHIEYLGTRSTSVGSNTIVQANDTLGLFIFRGDDGTNFATEAASILGEVDGTPGENDMPGRLIFRTTADGAAIGTERMRIDNAGRVLINYADIPTGLGTNKGLLQVANSDTTYDWTQINTDANGYASTANEIAVINSANNDVNGFAGLFMQAGETTDGATISAARIGAIRAATSSAATDLAFAVRGGDSVMSEAMRIDSSQRLLIGYTENVGANGHNAALQVVGQGTADYHGASVNIVGFSNNSNGAYLQFASGRSNTAGTYTIVADNDTTGQINFMGADGTDMNTPTATIQSQVDGTPGANDMPGRLQFYTTADGASSPTERMRISANGAMLFDVESGGIMAMSVGTSAGVATDCFEINLSGATFACYVDVVTNQSAGYAGRTSQFLWYGRRAGAGNSRGTVELSTNSLGSVNAGVVAVATITASATNPTGTLERFQITTDLATDSIYCIIRAIGNIPTLKILN